MGLSSSTSKTNTTQNQNSNQTESGTTTPITPDWLTNAASDYVDRIGSFGQMDPNSFVAPSSPLQNMAWNNASSLGDWRGQAATAAQMAAGAGQGGANLGGAMGRYAGAAGLTPNVQMSGGSAQMAASQLGGDKMMPHTGNMPLPVDQSQRGSPPNAFSGASSQQQGPAYQAQASSYSAPNLNTPGLVSGQGYSAPQLGQAGSYAAARTGAPIGAAVQGYNPTSINASQIAQTPGATATNATAGSLLDNLSAYQNPYNDQVRNAALSDFDQQAARDQARLEAQGARNGAFGGSRFGIAQGQLLGDQDRARASLDAGLLDQGFNTAAGLSQSDAANRQQASLFNAQNQTGVSQFNSGQDAARSLAQAGFGQQASLANQAATDAASQFGSAAYNASQGQYADAANRAALDYSGRQDTASQFGLGQQQQRDMANAGYTDAAARYGADSSMQAALANQGMQGQFGLAQGQLDANAGQWNAGNQTAVSGQNAAANNNMSQFNAQQQDTALTRQLQAAGMLGGLANDYGTGTRADLGTMAQLGDQQRGIEQSYAMSGPAQLQLMGQLSGMTPYDILVGRQVNGNTVGNMTGTGTQTTTQSPGLMSLLMQGANAAARAYSGGIGG
jgi:hypothetical protein